MTTAIEKIIEAFLRHGLTGAVLATYIVLVTAVMYILYRELRESKRRNNTILKGFYKQSARTTSAMENIGNEMNSMTGEIKNTNTEIKSLGEKNDTNTEQVVKGLRGIEKSMLDVVTGFLKKNSST